MEVPLSMRDGRWLLLRLRCRDRATDDSPYVIAQWDADFENWWTTEASGYPDELVVEWWELPPKKTLAIQEPRG